MTQRARGPRTLRGAFVTIDPGKAQPDLITFTYNPATLKRSLKPQQVGGDDGDRSEAVRFTGAPNQTLTIEVELDAVDRLGHGDPRAMQFGVMPELARLELLVYPKLDQVNRLQSRLAQGVMEVSPMTAPRTLFVWGAKRVIPVRITGYEITEEMFDTRLNPIRASVTITMRVLTYNDVAATNREYFEFQSYQQSLAMIADQGPASPHPIGVDPGSI